MTLCLRFFYRLPHYSLVNRSITRTSFARCERRDTVCLLCEQGQGRASLAEQLGVSHGLLLPPPTSARCVQATPRLSFSRPFFAHPSAL